MDKYYYRKAEVKLKSEEVGRLSRKGQQRWLTWLHGLFVSEALPSERLQGKSDRLLKSREEGAKS